VISGHFTGTLRKMHWIRPFPTVHIWPGFYLLISRLCIWAHTVLAHNWLLSNRIRWMGNYPAVSPDLNAVESVWSCMNRYVQRNHPNSQQRLERLIQQAWDAIPQNVIRW
jgi:hypothetical protein